MEEHRIAVQAKVDNETYEKVVYPAKAQKKLGKLVGKLLTAYATDERVANLIDSSDTSNDGIGTNHVIRRLFDNIKQADETIDKTREFSNSIVSSVEEIREEIKLPIGEGHQQLAEPVKVDAVEENFQSSTLEYQDREDIDFDFEVVTTDSESTESAPDANDVLESLMNGNTFGF